MIEKLKSKLLPIVFLLLLFLGAFMMVFPNDSPAEKSSQEVVGVFDEAEYEKRLENRLKSLIERIDGVGSVSVMITLEGSAVYSYAKDSKEDVSADGDVRIDTSVVLSTKSSNVKEAVVSGYTLPKVKGAAVVCEKRLSATLIERVIKTVSASLGISTDKIYVTN